MHARRNDFIAVCFALLVFGSAWFVDTLTFQDLLADFRAEPQEGLRKLVDLLVILIGFCNWMVFLPQVRLLRSNRKHAAGLSLGTLWGSLAMQGTILLQSILRENWALTFPMTMSVIFIIVLLVMVKHYRKHPGLA